MRELVGIYGVSTYKQWGDRLEREDRQALRDLSDTKERSRQLATHPAHEVCSYEQLVELMSFLSVMNKNLILVYRGQTSDFPLQPSLLRESWTPPAADIGLVSLGGARLEYWDRLEGVGKLVVDILDDHGLPRWRHLERRPARWAVIQHYGLWPTPLLDFTTSLRIAASFAFDFDPSLRGEPPTLYAVGVRRLRSDLMTLSSDDDQERADSMLTIRLNSVCPPSAKRAHFQDAVLVGHYPFERHHVDDPELSNAEAILLAKCRLLNSKGAFWRSKGAFWRTKDFPIHSGRSLLPFPAEDALLRDLRASIAYELDDSGLVSFRRT